MVFCQLYVSYANVVYFQKPENAVKTFAKVQVINEPDGSKDIELVKNINSIEKKDLGSGQIFSLGSFNQLSYDDVMAKLNKTIKEQERHFAGNKSWDYFLGALHSALYLYRVPHKGMFSIDLKKLLIMMCIFYRKPMQFASTFAQKL